MSAKEKAATLTGEAAYKNTSCKSNYKAISSRSTSTADQRERLLILLQQGPKTTIELRRHGIMMPATRIFELKRIEGHTILSELLTQYDDGGYRHSKVARYSLVETVGKELQGPLDLGGAYGAL